jgi:hypothetical protein
MTVSRATPRKQSSSSESFLARNGRNFLFTGKPNGVTMVFPSGKAGCRHSNQSKGIHQAMIDRMSPALREHLSQACRNLPAALSENERNYEAMRTIVARINAGETGLYDPENSGDSLAIVLAQLE